MSDSRRRVRQRVYSLVTLGLMCVVSLVAMAGFLHVGQERIDARIYSSPVETLQRIALAQRRFRRKVKPRRYARSLAELERSGHITRRLAAGDVGGYRYRIEASDAATWTIRATPASVTTATPFFLMDETLVIHRNLGAPASEDSPVAWYPLHGNE